MNDNRYIKARIGISLRSIFLHNLLSSSGDNVGTISCPAFSCSEIRSFEDDDGTVDPDVDEMWGILTDVCAFPKVFKAALSKSVGQGGFHHSDS